jgi:hypothetical protein
MKLRALRLLVLPALLLSPVLGVAPPAALAASPARSPSARKARSTRPKKPAPEPAASDSAPAPPAAADPSEPGPAAPAAAGDPTPAPAPSTAAPPPPPPPALEKPAAATPGPDLTKLRAEHDTLRDALFRSRARRETVETALFSTKVATTLRWAANKHYTLKQAELRLDGVRYWESETPPGGEPLVLAPRSMPPGTHVLGVRIEVRARENPKLGYVSEQSFTVALPEGKQTKVEITIDEDGGLPSYNPEIEVEVSQ